MNELLVRRGQSLTHALWNAFWGWRRRLRLVAGPGVTIKDTPDGQIVSFAGGDRPFLHPWRCAFDGRFATFRLGTINQLIEPTIGGVPMAGDPQRGLPRPRLEIRADLFDGEGRSAAVVEVEADESGKTVAAKILQIPHSAFVPFGPQWILAVFRRTAAGSIERHQAAHFHLRHWARASGQSVRHFFDAQP